MSSRPHKAETATGAHPPCQRKLEKILETISGDSKKGMLLRFAENKITRIAGRLGLTFVVFRSSSPIWASGSLSADLVVLQRQPSTDEQSDSSWNVQRHMSGEMTNFDFGPRA